ncbi:PPE family protein [Mycobacterium parmense]|uniref:PPE family protein n=1 Tax=Mycobacterium parmense TaxID=185642 RepID=A0A7I7YZI6_9MYCO|nr:PPE family protein [Mycobacterium parmense]MCV7352720.1 PPE family protein [Mycobacterium parmense]ORW54634.1 hypothetical protein AWC20_19250 [Mycobacterium parmense]BBZ46727.1 PPE family protein [Mycobacterium parmense]
MSDFASLPPEVNSARMYLGPGSTPMLVAAAAWNGLGAELRSAASSYGSILGVLTGEQWHGPASAAMAAAALPYVVWMSDAATRAEHTASQAESAAAAYEAAFAATVPPPVVAQNRVRMAALVATNILGQNTAAIAATETQYAEMWAQDAAAMYGYAGSSAAATRLAEFTLPQPTTSPTGLTAQSAAVAEQSTLSQMVAAVPTSLQRMAYPASAAPRTQAVDILRLLLTGSGSGNDALDGFWNTWGPNGNIWNTVFSSGFYMPSNTLAPFLGLTGGEASGQTAAAAGEAAAGAAGEEVAGPVVGIAGPGPAFAAGLGQAATLGPLSVPPSWTASAPLSGPLASSLGGTPMVAPPPAMAAGLPGVPLGGGAAGQGYGRAVPQYGFRPTFVARPPAAG